MPRRALIRFLLAATALIAAAWVWHARTRGIDRPLAEARAARLLAAYIAGSGEPAVHFIRPLLTEYDDGWEFRWAYRPCVDVTELRVFVARSGTAHYAQLPDCNPGRGMMVRPRLV